MQSTYTVHIAASEWRWVIMFAIGLVLLAFVPFVWVTLSQSPSADWQFMGALHHHWDAAAYLSKIQQGMNGSWLVRFQHTPEIHDSAVIEFVYVLLGQIARVTPFTPILIFHVGRMAAAFFMYLALYHLAASIWMRIRTRRIFFLIVALSSGLGWLLASLTGDTSYPGLTMPQSFPFYSTLVNVHFPLTTACLSILASIIITALRPGVTEEPGIRNGGAVAFILGLVIALLNPETLIPLGIAMGVCILVSVYQTRRIPEREMRWGLWILVPALPIAMYDWITYQNNPAIGEWIRQRAVAAPPPLMLLIGLSLLLIVALPSLNRAVRRFEADGDRVMLVWLVAVVAMAYLPLNIRQNFLGGLMLPIAYFMTRAVEDFWFNHMRRAWRDRALIFALFVLSLSNLYVLFVPILPITYSVPYATNGMVLEPEYRKAFEWLAAETRAGDVILASPQVSAWIPVWVGSRVVYGHPSETLNASLKQEAVKAWYREKNVENCDALLRGQYSALRPYTVDYVIYGPREAALGDTICLRQLQFAGNYGSVSIYIVNPNRRLQ